MRLYRVFPWLSDAPEGEPGHALYVPTPGGAGRADNPLHYRALHFSDSPAGAVAEAFGTLKLWTSQMFVRPDLPGSVRTLAEYDLPDAANAVFDLDDASALASLGVRPSQVVTRDRRVTQRWALAVFEQGRWAGLRWWSWYNPDWYSYVIWALEALELNSSTLQPLAIDSPSVIEAAEILRRPIRT